MAISNFTPLSKETVDKLTDMSTNFSRSSNFTGHHYRFYFANGYGCSIAKNIGSYGSQYNLWEVAVIKDDDLCYDTKITDDVLGFLEEAEVVDIAIRISQL